MKFIDSKGDDVWLFCICSSLCFFIKIKLFFGFSSFCGFDWDIKSIFWDWLFILFWFWGLLLLFPIKSKILLFELTVVVLLLFSIIFWEDCSFFLIKENFFFGELFSELLITLFVLLLSLIFENILLFKLLLFVSFVSLLSNKSKGSLLLIFELCCCWICGWLKFELKFEFWISSFFNNLTPVNKK